MSTSSITTGQTAPAGEDYIMCLKAQDQLLNAPCVDTVLSASSVVMNNTDCLAPCSGPLRNINASDMMRMSL